MAIEQGFFRDEGIPFRYLPGGPNAPQPVIEISAGEAAIGDADWLPLLDAIAQGNDFVILGSLYPILPSGLITLPAHPIRTPADLPGKTFLVQGPTERAMLDALFRINRLSPDYKTVPVGFSPEPLLNGAGDAYFCYITNQPNTLVAMGLRQDRDFLVTRLYDLGYRVSTSLLTVHRRTLLTRRPTLVAFLRALLRGHVANAANPPAAAALATEKYGADLGLDLDQQTQLNRLQLPLETAPGTPIPFFLHQDHLGGDMYAVARASGREHLPDPSRLLDSTLLQEAFDSLKERSR